MSPVDDRAFLTGLRVSGFRSIGEPALELCPFSNLNIITGRNNSGKSNVLRLIHTVPSVIGKEWPGSPTEINRSCESCLIQLRINEADFRRTRLFQMAHDVTVADAERVATDQLWMGKVKSARGIQDISNIADVLSQHFGKRITHIASRLDLNIQAARGLEELSKTIVSSARISDTIQLPEIVHVPQFRKIEKGMKDDTTGLRLVNGDNVIDTLFRIQRPTDDDIEKRDKDRARFRNIEHFLAELLGEPDLEIEVPHTNDRIIVSIRNRPFQLRDLGTGIEHLLLMAVLVTEFEKSIVTIEEPEIHLHPDLQKKLVRFLMDRTSNQYFITTHSNAILDVPGSTVFHLELEEGASRVSRVENFEQHDRVLRDLGYTASDLLQSNCIIWVEGPSDRIFVNHWIRSFIDDVIDSSGQRRAIPLIEGLHYAVMFYGGSLISHLTCEPLHSAASDVDLIRLLRMNRNTAVVFDSDRSSRSSRLKDAQQRIKHELDTGGGFCWCTQGREIENYISAEVLVRLLSNVHPRSKPDWPIEYGRFSCVSRFQDGRSLNKVAIAHAYTETQPDWNVLDLRKQVRGLVNFVYAANHFPPIE